MPADQKGSRSRAKDPSERTGVFTTGVVSRKDGRDIAIFFTGKQHAGENLADVLRRRAAELDTPIQMCDALSRNLPQELKVILSNCLAHYLESAVIWRPSGGSGNGRAFLQLAGLMTPDNGEPVRVVSRLKGCGRANSHSGSSRCN